MSQGSESPASVWTHLNLRGLIPLIFAGTVGLTVNHYKERGQLDWVPDWGFDVILFVVLLLGVYFLWTQPDIQSALRLAYNRNRKMVALILIVVGMFIGGSFGLFGFWRLQQYQEAHKPVEHFDSEYSPIAQNVPDNVFSFYPSPMSECGAKKINFSARIGYSQQDSMRRIVIDLPEGCEPSTAQYALEHKQEILDQIIESMKKADPELLKGIPLDTIVILRHRHRMRKDAFSRLVKAAGPYSFFIEGPIEE